MVRIQDSHVWMIDLQIVGSIQPLVSSLRESVRAQWVIIQAYIKRSPLYWLGDLHKFMRKCWWKLIVIEPCQSHHQLSPRRYRSPGRNGRHNRHFYGPDRDVIHQGRCTQTVADQAKMTAKDEWRSRTAIRAANWPRRHHDQDHRSVKQRAAWRSLDKFDLVTCRRHNCHMNTATEVVWLIWPLR